MNLKIDKAQTVKRTLSFEFMYFVPGDVITANSDVIIGRPNGVSPRVPLHSNLDSPPIPSFPHHVNNIRDSIPLQSIQTESYIGPPPPLQTHQKNRLNLHKNQIHDSHRPAIIPFNNAYNDRGTTPQSHHEIRLSNSKNILSNSFLHPPPLKPQVNFHQDHQFKHQPANIPLIQPNEHQHPQPQIIHQQPKYQQQAYNQYQAQQHQIISAQSLPNIPLFKQDPLFEIQQIPEVFSTDLPPIHVLEYPQHPIEPSIQVQIPQVSIFSPLPDIQQSTGHQLLVNIQPSQIANIIIPHGSTTALIYGGANELHKNGEYFDEPSPYIDADINLFYSNKPNKTVANVINVDVPPNHQNHVHIQPHKPILANQEININANILSQDVDLHAPPIKFTLKEENYVQQASVNSNQHYDFERVHGYVEHATEVDNIVSSSKHQQNEHRLVVAQSPISTTSSDLTDLFNQQSNYVPHYNHHQNFNRQPNTYNPHNQNVGNQNQFSGNEYNVQNNTHATNNQHNGKNYYHKNPPNLIEYNGPPPSRQRQRPNIVKLNEVNTNAQTPPFYQHYYPQQHINRPTGSNIFSNSNQQQSSRPKPGKIVNFEPLPHTHQKPVYINLHEHVDSGTTHVVSSHAPSVTDVIVDEHKDDDFANQEGEVIQESNSVPVVPGQRPKDVFDVAVPTSSPKTMFYEIQHPSSYSGNEIVNTQTESSFMWNVSGTSNTHSGLVGSKKHVYPSAPPAVLINELSPENLYPPTVSPINKNRLEYGNRRRPVIPVRPLESSPPLHPSHGSPSAINFGGANELGKLRKLFKNKICFVDL